MPRSCETRVGRRSALKYWREMSGRANYAGTRKPLSLFTTDGTERAKDPWDYPDNCLATLCESCHEQETGAISQCDGYLQMIRENLWSDDLQSLAVDIAFGGPHSYNDLSVELASRVMIHPEWFRPIFDFLEREGLMRKD